MGPGQGRFSRSLDSEKIESARSNVCVTTEAGPGRGCDTWSERKRVLSWVVAEGTELAGAQKACEAPRSHSRMIGFTAVLENRPPLCAPS